VGKKKSSMFGGTDKKITGNLEKKQKVLVEFEGAVEAVRVALEALRPASAEAAASAAGHSPTGECGKERACVRSVRVALLEEHLADHERLSKNFAATLYGVFQVCFYPAWWFAFWVGRLQLTHTMVHFEMKISLRHRRSPTTLRRCCYPTRALRTWRCEESTKWRERRERRAPTGRRVKTRSGMRLMPRKVAKLAAMKTSRMSSPQFAVGGRFANCQQKVRRWIYSCGGSCTWCDQETLFPGFGFHWSAGSMYPSKAEPQQPAVA
jgi:hypothetical protein